MALASEGEPPETVRQKARRVSGDRERMARDAVQFVRAGFAEAAYKDGGWMYLTKRMMQSAPLTHGAALAVPLRLTAGVRQGVAMTDADDKLLHKLMASDEQEGQASLLAEIDGHVEVGADVTRAGVLQFCAARGHKHLVQPLLSRGAQMNAKDQHGFTALMIAASGVPGNTSLRSPEHDSSMVAILIEFGADRNIVDDDGRSALGHYLGAIRTCNDFQATFDTKFRKQKADPTLRRMLMPARGPTVVDMTCADDH